MTGRASPYYIYELFYIKWLPEIMAINWLFKLSLFKLLSIAVDSLVFTNVLNLCVYCTNEKLSSKLER